MADRSDPERAETEEHGILDEERVDTSGIFLGGSTAQVDVAFPVPADDDDTIDEDFDESGHDRDVTHPDAAERADTAEADENDEDRPQPAPALGKLDEGEPHADVNRIFAKTDSHRDAPEANHRRSVIQHLRAAVAATRPPTIA